MKRMMIAVVLLVLAACVALAAEEAAPDTVFLLDGSVLKGTIRSLTEESLRIVTSTGQDLTIAMDKVRRFERGDAGEESGSPAPLALEVNLLGLLQFGPFVRLHIKVAPDWFLSPHVRLGIAGALNYIIWDGGGIAAGASLLRIVPAAGANVFYVGPFLEGGADYEDDFVVVLGANAGYRWRFANGSFWNAGVIAGASYDVSDDYLFVAGMLELSWGWEF